MCNKYEKIEDIIYDIGKQIIIHMKKTEKFDEVVRKCNHLRESKTCDIREGDSIVSKFVKDMMEENTFEELIYDSYDELIIIVDELMSIAISINDDWLETPFKYFDGKDCISWIANEIVFDKVRQEILYGTELRDEFQENLIDKIRDEVFHKFYNERAIAV